MVVIRESARAKHLRVTVYPDGEVVVTKPPRASARRLESFIDSKRQWIEETRARLMKRAARRKPEIVLPKPRKGSGEYKEAVARARALVHARLPELNSVYSFSYGRISIRSQKTRWGSCSLKGNLNFNYKIAYLPPELADYLLVHELCHLKEMNHSPRFWALVERSFPDYKSLRKRLGNIPPK